MKIPNEFLAVILGAVLAVQGWTLLEIVNLKVALASLNAQINPAKTLAKTQ